MSKAFGVYDTVDELSDALREIDRLRAEIERLSDELVEKRERLAKYNAEAMRQIEQLRAENERLRTALEAIAGMKMAWTAMPACAAKALRGDGDEARNEVTMPSKDSKS